jgi:rare lipoprotein A (peptidoglycan hydrolase)
MAAVPVVALAHASPPPSTPQATASATPISVIAALGRPARDRASRSDTTERIPDPPTTVPETSTTTARAAAKPTLYRAAPRVATTVAPMPRRVTTTSRPAPKAAPASSAAPSSSTAPRPTSAAAPSGNTQSGGASWYDAAAPGTCAHRTLPKGTVVHITDVSNGATATCTVSDRGPYVDGLIIDLAKDVFSRMAPLSTGVIQVRITW